MSSTSEILEWLENAKTKVALPKSALKLLDQNQKQNASTNNKSSSKPTTNTSFAGECNSSPREGEQASYAGSSTTTEGRSKDSISTREQILSECNPNPQNSIRTGSLQPINASPATGDIRGDERIIPEEPRDTSSKAKDSLGLRTSEGCSVDSTQSGGLDQQPPAFYSSLPNPDSKYQMLEFDNPAEMYAYYRDDIKFKRKSFHKWQAQELLRVAGSYTQDDPLKLIICACNGSGKDSYFISPAAVWLIACKIRHKVIITSSSYNQLSKQTEPYIRAFCEAINEKEGKEIFTIKLGHIHCNHSGSDIFMFVTDDPGKAEGFHPYDDYMYAEMTIIINESKSISKDIFQALARCTGYTRWLEVSSPGKTSGHMYDAYCISNMYPSMYIAGKWYSRKITYLDCPHLTKNQIEDDKILCGGESSEFFRSKYLAEFTSLDDRVVVSKEKVDECLALKDQIPWDKNAELSGGLDLSGGRDETACASRQGNRLNKLDAFKIKDATLLVAHLEANIFPSHSFTKETPIYTDAGGMGEPICDMLLAHGWNIIPVLNQHRAANSRLYRNRGTENWFNFGNAIKLKNIILINDKVLLKQLSSRRYDLPDNDKICLLSKQEEKAEGNESPDRADAVALCFMKYQISTTLNLRASRRVDPTKEHAGNRITQKELVAKMEDSRFKNFTGHNLITKRTPTQTREASTVFSQESFIKGGINNYNNERH